MESEWVHWSDVLGIDASGLLWRINVGDVRSRSSVLFLILGTRTDKFASREGWFGTEIVAFFHHEASRRTTVMASVNRLAAGGAAGDVEMKKRPEDVNSAPEDEPSPNARPAVFRSTAQEILFIATATMSVAMPSFLQGSTIVISSSIKRDLNMTTSQLTWMTASSA